MKLCLFLAASVFYAIKAAITVASSESVEPPAITMNLSAGEAARAGTADRAPPLAAPRSPAAFLQTIYGCSQEGDNKG